MKLSAMHGIFVVESIVSPCSLLSPPRVAGIRILVDVN